MLAVIRDGQNPKARILALGEFGYMSRQKMLKWVTRRCSQLREQHKGQVPAVAPMCRFVGYGGYKATWDEVKAQTERDGKPVTHEYVYEQMSVKGKFQRDLEAWIAKINAAREAAKKSEKGT